MIHIDLSLADLTEVRGLGLMVFLSITHVAYRDSMLQDGRLLSSHVALSLSF